MNLIQLQTEDHRRSVLWFLLYDADYQLSLTMLAQCFGRRGEIECLTLTDRGLEVAKGLVRAVGVRNLRPSELADIKAFKGY